MAEFYESLESAKQDYDTRGSNTWLLFGRYSNEYIVVGIEEIGYFNFKDPEEPLECLAKK